MNQPELMQEALDTCERWRELGVTKEEVEAAIQDAIKEVFRSVEGEERRDFRERHAEGDQDAINCGEQ